ncbi:MAG TPA: (2Fe-2S)-binding protein [Candidatus Binataceae bacterium]|nr:(2Fe-2S)-binding protein [Candidatus Binataceae bacterium]
MKKRLLRLKVNGEPKEVAVEDNKTLLEVLREDLGLAGTKHGCETGECGLCTVLLDGTPVLSCLMLGIDVEGADVRTIEGVSDRGRLRPLQSAFAELGATQCGYCSPAMILTAEALLKSNPRPTRQEIREALSGVLCRCTGYSKIIDAVQAAVRAEKL